MITNRHIVQDGRPRDGRLAYSHAYFAGQWRKGKVTCIGKGDCDLALIEIPYKGGHGTAATLSANAPKSGDSITLQSFVGGLRFSEQSTTLLADSRGVTSYAAVPISDGQSGGGVYDADGKLVGILYGVTDTQRAAFVNHACLRKFWADCGIGNRGPPVRVPPTSSGTNCQSRFEALNQQIAILQQRIIELESREPRQLTVVLEGPTEQEYREYPVVDGKIVLPPQRMQIEHVDGHKTMQSQILGDYLKLKIVPKKKEEAADDSAAD